MLEPARWLDPLQGQEKVNCLLNARGCEGGGMLLRGQSCGVAKQPPGRGGWQCCSMIIIGWW